MIALSLAAALLSAAQSSSQGNGRPLTFVEDFETGTNVGNWSYFGDPANDVEVLEPDGGHPGRFLHATCAGLGCLDSFAPQLRTQDGIDSVFTGNYRANGVRALGVDLATFGPEFVTTAGRPLTLMLTSDPGTPDDPFDDVVVYRIGHKNIPRDNGHWRRFTAKVPSDSATLPRGWKVLQGTGDADADWNTAITGVTQVTWFYGDPELFFIFQQWELGVDNLRIVLDASAAAR